MQNAILTLGKISWGRRLMLASAALGLLLVFGFTQTASAQNSVTTPCSITQLCLDNNYFVTGDYVVGGDVFDGTFVNGLAMGKITIPDPKQPNSTSVPAGADIVAAFLYWETVETTSGVPITGRVASFNGYTIDGGSPLGNPTAPSSWSTGGCSGGNGNGAKTMHMYRADVRPFLPVDANGRVLGNGSFSVGLQDSGSNGNGVPISLGATLVIIYRVQSPLVPLNSIVLYDGAVAPNNTSSTFTQPIVGFYQAAASPMAKITHIAGNGQPNKGESVSLNGVTLPNLYPNISTIAAFPGIYNGSWDNPTWTGDNSSINTALVAGDTQTTSVAPTPTNGNCANWGAIVFSTTVPDPNRDALLPVWKTNQGYTDAKLGQPVALPGADKTGQFQDIFFEVDYLCNLATCDPNASGYLHSHLPKQQALDMVGDAFAAKNVHAHFDVGSNYQKNGVVNCSTTSNACPDPYIIPAGTGGNAIPESAVVCKDGTTTTLCQFPGQVAVGWKGGFLFVKDNPCALNGQAVLCTTSGALPLGSFQFGRKDSYHYVLFGHALGEPRSFWTAFGTTLNDPTVASLVSIVNSGTTATVTVQTPQGLVKPGDCSATNVPPACTDANGGRVTISEAIRQPALNGTYLFTNASSNPDPNNPSVTDTTFNITTSGLPTGTTTYNFSNEPRLAVEYGGPTSTSGHSDVGGADTAVTFGLWPADDINSPVTCQPDPSITLQANQSYCTNQVGTITAEAGTLLHEGGHTLFLTHGGTFFAGNNNALPGQQTNSPLGFPGYGLNCNPAFLSSMNYLFQIRGFPDGILGDPTHPLIDYSGQTLPNLSESALNEGSGIGFDMFTSAAAPHLTRWYAPSSPFQVQIGQFATAHCDGTPILDGAKMFRVSGSPFTEPNAPSGSGPIDWNLDGNTTDTGLAQDLNFNDNSFNIPSSNVDLPFPGFNDWINTDLRQIDSRANPFGLSAGGNTGSLSGFGGGNTGSLSGFGGGNTGSLSGFGGGTINDLSGLGGGTTANLSGFGGGTTGSLSGFGGGTIQSLSGLGGGPNDQDVETACSTADPPFGLTATPGTKSVILNWKAPGGPCQVRQYDIWRATSPSTNFTDIQTLPRVKVGKTTTAPLTTFTDTNVKNNTTYVYFVTDTDVQGATSGTSNIVPILVKF
jgi:hypothetical protein